MVFLVDLKEDIRIAYFFPARPHFTDRYNRVTFTVTDK